MSKLELPVGRRTALFISAAVALLAYGLWRAAALAWLCDDAFISFRYAENWALGHGLVYNPGEPVEGYTNFLWTFALGLLLKAGVSPTTSAHALGIASFAVLATALGWRALRRGDTVVVVAAPWLLLAIDVQRWATGGLETMSFAALAAIGLVLAHDARGTGSRWGAGLLLALCVLSRLDGALFVVVASLFALLGSGSPRERLARTLPVALPTALVLAVWLPAKLYYYGDLFPTAFYSKSVTQVYASQGFVYVGLFLARYPGFALGLVVVPIAARFLGRRERSNAERDAAFFGSAAALYTAYLIWVGGDFMFARRMVPVVPLALLALEGLLRSLPGRSRHVLAVGLVASAVLPWPLYDEDRKRIHFVTDEPRYYPPERLEARRLQAETVAAALSQTEARIAFEGGMCVFGYYSRLPYQVEVTGLTNYSLAKQPISSRGYVGHEKLASAAWLRENRIHMLVRHSLPPLPADGERPFNSLRFGNVAEATIYIYDDDVMDPLRERRDVSFLPIEALLRRSMRRIAKSPISEAESVLEDLRDYYFDHAGERGRPYEERLVAVLEARRQHESR